MGTQTFEVNQEAVDLLCQLRGTFGVSTNAAVIRKALALASVVSRYAASDGTIMISTRRGASTVTIRLAE
jgi:hypothetical protein